MIDRHHDLPLNRQARALGISRGSVWYLPRAASSADLALMRAIDALIWNTLSPAAACCRVCCCPRGMSLGVSTSRR